MISDRDAAVQWHGASGDGADYWRACEPLNASPDLRGLQLELAGEDVVIWDMPAGTADVWRVGERSIQLTWSWLDDFNLEARAELAALPRGDSTNAGAVAVRSGWLLVMWAADDGAELVGIAPSPGLALDLSVGGSGVLVEVPAGRYIVQCDEVHSEAGGARRAFLQAEDGP